MRPILFWFAFAVAGASASGHTTKKTDSGNWEGHLRADHQQPSGDYVSVPSSKKDNPIGSIIFGFLLWCLAPVCLWNNERIAIKQYKMRFKAERWAIHIDDTTREPLKEMDGRIVYLSGISSCDESLSDSEFPLVKSEGKIKLRRVFQMFQWVEKSKEEGSGDNKRTVYWWEKEWSDKHEECPHDSHGTHQNPQMPIPSTKRQAPYRLTYDVQAGNGELCAEAAHEKVRLGAYYLGELVIRELLNWKKKEDVTAEMVRDSKPSKIDVVGEPVQKDGWWYWGDALEDIGKVRVLFEELCPGPTSIVGVLTETKQGCTFAPIKREDAAGTGDNCAAEICGCCCIRVKELHYGEEEDDDEFKDDLKSAPEELSKKEKAAFRRSETAANVEEYAIEEDFSDLCCVGPFGGAVIKLMHYLGLEEEFLAVREKQLSIGKVMEEEGNEAASRHHMARLGGFLLLAFGSWCIISPIVKILNYNWITTLLGGGLISAVLCCAACLCSVSCFALIVSTAWIAHRPFLASIGILTAIAIVAGIYCFVYEQEQKEAQKSGGVQATFLIARHAFLRGFAHL